MLNNPLIISYSYNSALTTSSVSARFNGTITGSMKYKPTFDPAVAGLTKLRSSSPRSANVSPRFWYGTESTVTVAVNTGDASPYFLDLPSATTRTIFFTFGKKYKVSEVPPSRLLGVIGGVYTYKGGFPSNTGTLAVIADSLTITAGIVSSRRITLEVGRR